MSTISIEIDDERLKRLRQIARAASQTPDATVDTLIEEGLRLREFPGIHFRDTGIGRQAFVPSLRLPIYFLAELAREVDNDVDKIAEYYNITTDAVAVSLDYIRSYPDEINRAIAANDAVEDELVASLTPDGVVTVQ